MKGKRDTRMSGAHLGNSTKPACADSRGGASISSDASRRLPLICANTESGAERADRYAAHLSRRVLTAGVCGLGRPEAARNRTVRDERSKQHRGDAERGHEAGRHFGLHKGRGMRRFLLALNMSEQTLTNHQIR